MVSCLIRTALHSPGIRTPSPVPSVPGSSGSPRLISCKVVPSCRNEGRFAQGPPLCCSKSPTTPRAQCQEEWLSATVNCGHHTHCPQRFAEKSNGLGTRDTSRQTLCHQPPALGRWESVVPRGCHLEIFSRHPRLAVLWVMCVLWLPPFPSVPLLTALATVHLTKICATLASR